MELEVQENRCGVLYPQKRVGGRRRSYVFGKRFLLVEVLRHRLTERLRFHQKITEFPLACTTHGLPPTSPLNQQGCEQQQWIIAKTVLQDKESCSKDQRG